MNRHLRGNREEFREEAPDSAWVWRMSRLARDGAPELVSRDQILRRERGQGFFYFFIQLITSRIGNLTPLIPNI